MVYSMIDSRRSSDDPLYDIATPYSIPTLKKAVTYVSFESLTDANQKSGYYTIGSIHNETYPLTDKTEYIQ